MKIGPENEPQKPNYQGTIEDRAYPVSQKYQLSGHKWRKGQTMCHKSTNYDSTIKDRAIYCASTLTNNSNRLFIACVLSTSQKPHQSPQT